MGKVRKIYSSILLWGLLLTSLLPAQVVVDLDKISKKPGFHVDLGSFYDPASAKIRLEVYYQIHNNYLTFVKAGPDYLAAYELRVLVLKGEKQVAGTSLEEQYPVSTYAETISPYDYVINQLTLEVQPGKYDTRITLIDKKAQRGYSLNLSVTVPDYSAKEISISDLEFAEYISDTLPGSQFNKFQTRVVPKVNQQLEQSPESLWFYFEMYFKKPRPVEIEYVTLNQWEKRITKFAEKLRPEATLLPLVRSVPTANLPPGRYTLRATVLGGTKNVLAETRQDFLIDWSIAYFVEHDFQEAIEFLRYLATGEEIKALKNTPADQQTQAWKDFWKSKDPTPATLENEVQDEYYRRMRYANDKFTGWSKAGWKTDLGMVYIKYGEPDEIDRHPYDMESRSYEVWYYYRLRRVFTFLDEGYGEYKLQYPYDGDVYHLR